MRVTDAAAAVAERAFNVVVTSSLSISSCPAPNALQGQSYSSAATGAGGQPPYTWTLAAGTLPAGSAVQRVFGWVERHSCGRGCLLLHIADRGQERRYSHTGLYVNRIFFFKYSA